MPSESGIYFDYIGAGNKALLRYRIGVVFPAGEAPDPANVCHMVPLPPPSGATQHKFYCPALGVDLLEVGRAEYHIDSTVREASRAELFVNQRPGCSVWFGRFGQERAFGFHAKTGKYSIPLWIKRVDEGGFAPLYISVKKGIEVRYFCLGVEWIGSTISVSIRRVEEIEVPDFLQFRPNDITYA